MSIGLSTGPSNASGPAYALYTRVATPPHHHPQAPVSHSWATYGHSLGVWEAPAQLRCRQDSPLLPRVVRYLLLKPGRPASAPQKLMLPSAEAKKNRKQVAFSCQKQVDIFWRPQQGEAGTQRGTHPVLCPSSGFGGSTRSTDVRCPALPWVTWERCAGTEAGEG